MDADGTTGEDWRYCDPHRERRPVVLDGNLELTWYEDRQEYVDQQIKMTADGGLDFFAFEYFTNRQDGQFVGARENNSNGLEFFRTSPNKRLMRFALLYVNNDKFSITDKEEGKAYVRKWVNEYFTDRPYLKIDGKPVFIIINTPGMLKDWADGLPRQTHDSIVAAPLSKLRKEAAKARFPGVLIGGGICRPTQDNIEKAVKHGYDFLTSFNAGFVEFASDPDCGPLLTARENPNSALTDGGT
jgi:hypothetical protein